MPEIQFTQKVFVSTKIKTKPGTDTFTAVITPESDYILYANELMIRDVKWVGNPEDGRYFSIRSNLDDYYVKGPLRRIYQLYHSEIVFTIKYDIPLWERVIAFMKCEPLDYEIEGEVIIELEFITYKKN